MRRFLWMLVGWPPSADREQAQLPHWICGNHLSQVHHSSYGSFGESPEPGSSQFLWEFW
ncbi:hypothetical protein EMIT0P228_10328 [Pseudomonas brassicacearum]